MVRHRATSIQNRGFVRATQSPLSLLALCQGLLAMLSKCVTDGCLHMVNICQGAPTISHLFLPMIAFFWPRLLPRIANKSWMYCIAMKELIFGFWPRLLASWLITKRMFCVLVETSSYLISSFWTMFWVCNGLIGTNNIWVFLLWSVVTKGLALVIYMSIFGNVSKAGRVN